MKLTEKQIDLLAQELIIETKHFAIFEKKIGLNLFEDDHQLSFEQRLKMFYSIYHTCKVIQTNKNKPKRTNEQTFRK